MTPTVRTGGSTDPTFDKPYIDRDENIDTPVPHRYVHGGFTGTDTRFSIYFPPPERYEGRFFHPLMPISGTEHAALGVVTGMIADPIGFAIASGGYLVESNLGRTVMFPGPDATLVGYRASSAVARYSRVLAREMYGEHRPYGYVFGGSGGAFKTMACIENCPGVWDGAVPFVPGSPASMPNLFSVQAHAMRVLRGKFPQIVDAVEPGGSGDPYEGLNNEEREALAEVTRMGFPTRMWFDAARIGLGYTGVFASLIDSMTAWDPKYFDDFWELPGYLGANPPESLQRARLQHKTTIAQVVMASEAASLGLPISMSALFGDSEADVPAGVRLESLPDGELQGASITATSGAASGHTLHVAGALGDLLLTGFGEKHLGALRSLCQGDEVLVDNATYLAAQTYHRHQVPSAEYQVWNQFRSGSDPVPPQRPRLLGPLYTRGAAGSLPTGRFAGKMIVLASLMDEMAFPWQADWYHQRIRDIFGDRTGERYRLWFMDHCMHTRPWAAPGEARPVRTTRVVNYTGALQQALRDLSAWVEHDVPPPDTTNYSVEDGQVVVAASASRRRGIQPVVTLNANGRPRADVRIHQPVHFSAVAEVPPAAGTIVAAEWDFDGAGDFPVSEPDLGGDNAALTRVELNRTHTFAEAGTYFPALRVTSHRQGNGRDVYGRVLNLGRVRVVVHDNSADHA